MSERLLRRFVERERSGEPQSARDRAAIADAFKLILAGADARKALGVARRVGNPGRSWERWHNEVLKPVMEVEELRRDGNMTLDAALDLVAKRRVSDADEREKYRGWLEKHHKKHRKDALLLL